MSTVLLLQLDGKLPNLALMRLAAYHRGRGDPVELRHVRRPDAVANALAGDFHQVYGSLIFEKSRPIAEQLQRLRPDAMIGGTGWNLARTLADVGVPAEVRPDYSDYPAFKASIGFSQRGCRLACPFCHVPAAEGRVHPVASIADIWRGEPWPRHIALLDNDFFGQPDWRARVEELNAGRFRVCVTQGVNVRLFDDEQAAALASLNYRDLDFKQRRLYTAWDNRKDEDRLFRNLALLTKHGVRADNIVVFMLISYWAGETQADWVYRAKRLREFGARPYPMPFHRHKLSAGFQRFIVGAYDKRVSWEEFRRVRCEPRLLGRTEIPPERPWGGRQRLPVIDVPEGEPPDQAR
jgi:hypothetical protein